MDRPAASQCREELEYLLARMLGKHYIVDPRSAAAPLGKAPELSEHLAFRNSREDGLDSATQLDERVSHTGSRLDR
jgi:hypothetical protein